MKKLVVVLLSLLLAFSFVACGETSGKKTYKVGVCQLIQHPALDSATQGFIDALNEALPDQVQIENQNASGESANCATIVNGYVSAKKDLIMANATAALQAAVSATDKIPVLGTSITAYGVALDIENFSGTVGGNVSGTSDLADLDATAAMLKEWFPDKKTVGFLFCSAEPNSRYQVDEMNKRLSALGYTCTEFTFTDSNDIASVTEKACSSVEVIYVPTDNAAASNGETIANITLQKKIPVVAGEEGICKSCGVCTLSISYYDLGFTTGKMAAKILTGEAKVSEMAIEYAPAKKMYNASICEQLGLTAPAGYEAIKQ